MADLGGADYVLYCYIASIIFFILVFPCTQFKTSDEIVIIRRYCYLIYMLGLYYFQEHFYGLIC